MIDLRRYGDQLAQATSSTLIRTGALEVVRLVLPAGKKIPRHQAAGAISVQCLEGSVVFECHRRTHTLHAARMLFLQPSQPHALEALVDTCILLTKLNASSP